ncbi:MAG: glycosyltransferase family 1 protein [Chloroflexi bacterium]|nr:glycosyltransferase family 1 protein [Chloroflexota bacterium]
MKIIGRVNVSPAPGRAIGRLTELAYNLWWSWHPSAQALYEEVDADLWRQVNHNAVKFLRRVSQQKLDRAASNPAYLARYAAVMAEFDAYMHPPAGSTWCERTCAEASDRLIAYFSAEFGLHESLPIYSGGLGILAGDHVKTASDLGLPFVGVGFLYPQGYFQQRIDADGRQQAIYEKLDFSDAPATPALGPDGKQVIISVELSGRIVHAMVWRVQVGRVPVYLMDTDVELNAPADRELSARLYGGNHEMRISQEVILGIGGVRALRSLGLWPAVWHMNEGHAAFLQLERLREYVQDRSFSLRAALWAVKADSLFTTHTPVPAGNDAFNFDLMDRFFGGYWGRLGLDRESFLGLGRFDYPWGPQFSMTVLALRTAGAANGVSRLHGEVSRRMWRGVWPETTEAETPIGHVTNGVHTATWLDPGLAALLDRHLEAGWRDRLDDPQAWTGVSRIPDEDLWAQHLAAKMRMIALVRERVAAHRQRIAADAAEINAAAHLFDPRALTIGFARRFATYKRATLIFRDQERLKRILNDPERPVQIIFAGKAHPADEPGKAFIQTIFQLSRQPGFAGRIVFVEDYDANIGRALVNGADLWLNNPRRPLEASGTSGQKAGLNGVPNCSVLDGWWCEGYDGQNGWAIGQGGDHLSEAAQDEADALALLGLLENEIVPLYYAQDGQGIPRGWLAKMKASIASVGPAFSFDRMLKEYVTQYYGPAGALGAQVSADDFAAARDLADWEARVRAGWPQVRLSATGPTQSQLGIGQTAPVQALLHPGPLSPDDLAVELIYGRERDGDLIEATATRLRLVDAAHDEYRYEDALMFSDSGPFAYGVRVRPAHPHLANPFAMYLVKWA